MPKMPRIILASRSPARRKLFKELSEEFGFDFECHTSGYEEDMSARKTAPALAKFLAYKKAEFVAHTYPNSIIIGADTFGTMNGKKLGKPKSITDAKNIIRAYSESSMKVHTGVAVISTADHGTIVEKLTDHAVTTVHFGKISEKDIEEIIQEDDILNVAGALKIEGKSGKHIHTIHGDYHNVIGLPLFQVEAMLKEMLKKV
mgnify:FL=1